MNRVATSGANVRALREFGLALHSGPFRVALALSLVVHLGLLAFFGWGKPGREGGGERRIPLMRVRLLSPAAPVGVPAAPAIKPAVKPPRREHSGRTAEEVQPPPSAPTLRAPEDPVATVAYVPEFPPATEMTVRGESRERQASEETTPPPAPLTPGAAGTAAVAATSSRRGPGPGDLEAVRHRIDAHKVYPQIALRNGWEGRVLVEMRLEGDGSLAAVRLLEGSGYAVLDDATISAVRRASPFPPVARVLTVPVEYRLLP